MRSLAFSFYLFLFCTFAHAGPSFVPDSVVTVDEHGGRHVEYIPVLGEVISGSRGAGDDNFAFVKKKEPVQVRLAQVQIDTTNSFGRIDYKEGISPTGARTYSVPIPTAPGHALAPQLHLYYNSQSGRGLAGHGWTLAGLSSISVIPKNPYYHGTAAAADTNSLYATYALDGVPLVQNEIPNISSAYPLVTARGNIVVRKDYKRPGGKFSGFTAKYPDGSTAIFEHKENSFAAHSYPISRYEDRFGNVINFYYRQDQPLNYPEIISYGRDSVWARLLFNYEEQSCSLSQYYCGINVAPQLRISRILSSDADGHILCFVDLDYTTDTWTDLLTGIHLERDGQPLNPLVFQYGTGTSPSSTDTMEQTGVYALPHGYTLPIVAFRGHFFPDSPLDGFVRYPAGSTYDIKDRYPYYDSGKGAWSEIHKFGSGYHPAQRLLVDKYTGPQSPEDEIVAGEGFQFLWPADVDGDGVDEVIRARLSANEELNTRLDVSVFHYSPDWERDSTSFTVYLSGVVVQKVMIGSEIIKSFASPHQRFFQLGRFYGDGKLQLLAYSPDTDPDGNAQPSRFAVIDLENGQKLSEEYLFPVSRDTLSFIRAVDIDGDGRTELLRKNGSFLEVYKYYAGEFSLSKTLPIPDAFYLWEKTFVTDLNSDGYLDFVTPPGSGSLIWHILYYTGTELSPRIHTPLTDYASSDEYLFLDVNSDNFPDMVRRHGTTLSTFLNDRGILSIISRDFPISSGGLLLPGRVNNNRLDRGVYIVRPVIMEQYEFTFNMGEHFRIGRFTDSFGNTTDSHYEELSAVTEEYLPDPYRTVSTGFSSTGPFLPLLTFQKSTTSSGLTFKRDSLRYGGMVSHNTGLGFCGFSRTVTNDLIRGTVTQTRFNPEKMGVPISTTVALGSSPDVPFSSTQYTWDDHSTTYGKMDPRLSSTLQTDSLSRTDTWVSYLYNTYGYQTFSQTTKNPVGEGVGERLHHNTRYHDVVYADRYILGVVQADSQTRIPRNPSDTCLTTYTTFEYDSLYRPSAVRQYCRYGPNIGFATGGLVEKETLYSYDSHGNVTSERTALYGSQTYLEESFAYDSTGRFLISETDSRGLTTTYGDHDVWGNPRVTTDPMGLVTRDSLDAWGNLVLRRNWDGSADTTRTLWGGEGLYKTISSGSITPRHITHYDALGREIRSEEERFDGSFLKTDRTYDAQGRLATETRPYKTAPDTYVNTVYSYDAYGRPLGFVQGDRSETVTYSGLSTTTTRDRIPSTVTTDAWGQAVSVQDPGGTISYSLRVDGQPDSVTAPGGVVTSFSYDAYGRRRRMVDPSAGVLTDSLAWYADGTSKLFHRNPGGQITTSYNKWGDVTRIDREGEFSTVYTYDAYGRLNACSNSNGTGIHYYLHPSSPRPGGYLQTGPDDYILELTYNRDSWGRITGEFYDLMTPSDYCTVIVTHEYAHGYMTKSTVSGETTILELVAENDAGLPSQVTTGSVLRRYTYDDYGRPATRSYGYYMPLSTEFSPATGNLRSRTDYSGDAETFSYDALGRLTSCSLDGFPNPPGSGVSYSFNGNILSKSGYGSMSYSDVSHPYRVTSITPERPGLDVPEREQTISYTSSGRPASISEGGVTAAFTYDADGQRLKMAVTDSTGGRILTRYYLGGCLEVDVDPSGVEKKKFYLGGDYYSAPAVLVKTGSAPATFYNIIRDCQGSIMRVTSEGEGSMAGNYSYDAWGRMRSPGSYSPYAAGTEPELFLGRGWCGHEHLPWFGLINLNARLYDPVLGRFLSPDPYVQAPDFTQSFNRYSYCLNNPLKYTDQSGELIWEVVVVGAILGALNGYMMGVQKGAKGWEMAGYVFGGGLLGGVTSWVGGAIASAVTPLVQAAGYGGFVAGAVSGGLSGLASGFIAGTGYSLLGGSSFADAIHAGGVSGLIGFGLGGLTGGIAEGWSAFKDGKSFWNGTSPSKTTPPVHPVRKSAEKG